MNDQRRVAFDASAALAFALKDEDLHAAAVALVADLARRNVEMIAPPLFEYEACLPTSRAAVANLRKRAGVEIEAPTNGKKAASTRAEVKA